MAHPVVIKPDISSTILKARITDSSTIYSTVATVSYDKVIENPSLKFDPIRFAPARSTYLRSWRWIIWVVGSRCLVRLRRRSIGSGIAVSAVAGYCIVVWVTNRSSGGSVSNSVVGIYFRVSTRVRIFVSRQLFRSAA